MITRNIAYKYGVANGSRGHLVGVVYAVGAPVGTFPEALVVDLPEYDGAVFYPGHPHWVPVLPKLSRIANTRQTREQFPVAAGYAVTVNKAQGLTLREGVVVNLRSGQRFKAASKHGHPFVAFTRSESFAMTAFKNLPPWDDFAKGRESAMLRMRLRFTEMLNNMHARTMQQHSKLATPELEVEAFEAWRAQRQHKKPDSRAPPQRHRCPGCSTAFGQ